MEVTINYAEAHILDLIETLNKEEEIIITKDGTPIVRLVPYQNPAKRKIGIADGLYNVPSTVEEFDQSNDEIIKLFEL